MTGDTRIPKAELTGAYGVLGLDMTKARAVTRWRESAVFTLLERDVLEYAEAMTQTPPTVTDELAARLLAALGLQSPEYSASCDIA